MSYEKSQILDLVANPISDILEGISTSLVMKTL